MSDCDSVNVVFFPSGSEVQSGFAGVSGGTLSRLRGGQLKALSVGKGTHLSELIGWEGGGRDGGKTRTW